MKKRLVRRANQEECALVGKNDSNGGGRDGMAAGGLIELSSFFSDWTRRFGRTERAARRKVMMAKY